MRHVHLLSGVGTLLLALFAGTADGAQRGAADKALGEMEAPITQRPMNRAFSYIPAAPGIATTPVPAQQPQTSAPATAQQDNSTRSFSYQAAPSNNVMPSNNFMPMNRRPARIPGYFRADRKALGEY